MNKPTVSELEAMLQDNPIEKQRDSLANVLRRHHAYQKELQAAGYGDYLITTLCQDTEDALTLWMARTTANDNCDQSASSKAGGTPSTDALEKEFAGWDKLRWVSHVVAEKLFDHARQLERDYIELEQEAFKDYGELEAENGGLHAQVRAAERELEALRGKLDGAKEADTEQYLAEVGRGIGALVPLTGSDD